jgi:hypothetical protein
MAGITDRQFRLICAGSEAWAGHDEFIVGGWLATTSARGS